MKKGLRRALGLMLLTIVFFTFFSCNKNVNTSAALNQPLTRDAYAPIFNPLNADQIFLQKAITYPDTNSPKAIYSIAGNSFTRFNYQGFPSSWGKNGKILFTTNSTYYTIGPIYSGNPDGTNPDSLFNIVYGTTCKWSPDCNKIASFNFYPHYATINNLYGTLEKLKILSPVGSPLDSVSLYDIEDCSWGDNNQIAVVYNHKFLNIYDSTLNLIKSIRIIADNDYNNFASSVAWIPNSTKVVWSSINGIYITDISSGQATLFKSFGSIGYTGICVSPDGTHIAATKGGSYSLINLATGAESVIPF